MRWKRQTDMMKEADGHDIDLPIPSSMRSICLFTLHCYCLMAEADRYDGKGKQI